MWRSTRSFRSDPGPIAQPGSGTAGSPAPARALPRATDPRDLEEEVQRLDEPLTVVR